MAGEAPERNCQAPLTQPGRKKREVLLIAKYVEKSEADLAWNKIRREVQYKINLAAAHWREQKQNELLPLVQARFEEALAEGTLLELERADGVAEEWLAVLAAEVGLA